LLPHILEHKFYAPTIGVVLEVNLATNETVELTESTILQ
jgi:hypothetical protein